jgi:energy-coupling factor transport system permease protein
MLKDITLGQYFPGDTLIHRLDPRTKIILTIVYIVVLFIAGSWISYALVAAFLALCVALSKIRLKTILSGLKPLILIMALTGLLNLFYQKGERLLVDWWIFHIYLEGIIKAFFMITRILLLITGTLPDLYDGAHKADGRA